MYRFTPPENAGRSFVEHAPHPDPILSPVMCRALGKRLERMCELVPGPPHFTTSLIK
jgi:hypothetical protein